MARRAPREIVDAIESMRRKVIQALAETGGGEAPLGAGLAPLGAGRAGVDVKAGLGGIRDVEFLVQGLQLIHAPDHPDVLATTGVVEHLSQHGDDRLGHVDRLRL